MNFQNAKESCIKELEKYIASRGSINSSGEFVPSTRTKMFRDELITAKKVQLAQDMIEAVRLSSNNTELKGALQPLGAGERIFE